MSLITSINEIKAYEAHVQILSDRIKTLSTGDYGLDEYSKIETELKNFYDNRSNLLNKINKISQLPTDQGFNRIIYKKTHNAIIKSEKLYEKLEKQYPLCKKFEKIQAYWRNLKFGLEKLTDIKELEDLNKCCLKQVNTPPITWNQIARCIHINEAIASITLRIIQKFKKESISLINQIIDLPEDHEKYESLLDKLFITLAQTLPDSGQLGKRLYTELSVDVITRISPPQSLKKDEKEIQFNLNLAGPSKDFLKYVAQKIPLLNEDPWIEISNTEIQRESSPVMKKSKEEVEDITQDQMPSEGRKIVRTKVVSFAELPRNQLKTSLSQFPIKQLEDFQSSMYLLISTPCSLKDQITQFRESIKKLPNETHDLMEKRLKTIQNNNSNEAFGDFINEVLGSIEEIMKPPNKNDGRIA